MKYHLYRFSQSSSSLVDTHKSATFEASTREDFLLNALDAFVRPCYLDWKGKKKQGKQWRKLNYRIRLQCAMSEMCDWRTLEIFVPSITPSQLGEYIEDHLEELFPQGHQFEKCDDCGLPLTDGHHILHCVMQAPVWDGNEQ